MDDALDPAAPMLDLDGFEGPLDLLLTLARRQKVDLRAIAVTALADQFLAAIAAARGAQIVLAADWLVMAAWLAYLKSQLLLPPPPEGEGPDPDALAAHLAWRLQRLDAMRAAAAQLTRRPLLGQDRLARGAPQPLAVRRRTAWQASLADLLAACVRVQTRGEFRPFAFERTGIVSMEEALERLRPLVGAVPDWTALARFLPPDWTAEPARRRSATAAAFAASLELARQGRIELRQDAPFAPLTLRSRP